MRPLLAFLSLTLCVAYAQAQPYIAPEALPLPPATILAPAPLVPRTGTPQEQIEADLTKFVDNLNTNKAYTDNNILVYGVNAGYLGANEWAKNWEALKIRIKLDDIGIKTVQGEQATAIILYHAVSGVESLNELFKAHSKGGAGDGMVETLTLRKGIVFEDEQEEHWQIVPPAKGFNPADPRTGIFASVTYVLAQKGTVPTDALAYVFNPEGDNSLHNIKQLTLAALQFTQDYDDTYSFQAQYAKEALLPYVKSAQLFRVPATQQEYTFNTNLSGKSRATIVDPYRTVLFYEGENQQPIFRYNGKAAIAFADGHCALVGPEEMKNVIWDVPTPRV